MSVLAAETDKKETAVTTSGSAPSIDSQRSAQQGIFNEVPIDAMPIDKVLEELAPGVVGTELGNNLKKFDNYYQNLNKQLNQRLKTSPRDPFQSNLSPQSRPKMNQNTRDIDSQRADSGFLNQVKAAVSLPGRTFTRSYDTPEIAFKGFMKAGGRNAALLEINGLGVVVVREGDVVGVGYGEETMIRIVKVNKLSVSLEVGDFEGQVVLQK